MHYLDLIDLVTPDWHGRAACHPDNGHDPELWFPQTPAAPPGERPARRVVIAPTIAICKRCPVRAQCLAAAKENGETNGIWGGVDFDKPNTREPINRCGTNAGYMVHLRKKEDACDECKKAHADKKRSAA